jgi:hypothetical protein
VLHLRLLFALLISALGIASLAFALVSLIYPIAAITETKGRLIAFLPAPTPASDMLTRQAIVQYQTVHGVDITITDTLPVDVSATSGDLISVTYFPWAAQEARIGGIGQSVAVAIGIQWVIILGGSLLGGWMSLMGMRLLRLERTQQYLLISVSVGVILLLAALPIIPRPSVTP